MRVRFVWGGKGYVLDVVAIWHIVMRGYRTVDGLYVVHEHKDAARENEDHRNDAQHADGVQAKEDICMGMARCLSAKQDRKRLTSTRRHHLELVGWYKFW